jgi:hypothetical protein
MQLLPVTQVITLPFASIRWFPDECDEFYNRRIAVQLKEIEETAHERFDNYEPTKELGLHRVMFDQNTGMVAIILLNRVQDLAVPLDMGYNE